MDPYAELFEKDRDEVASQLTLLGASRDEVDDAAHHAMQDMLASRRFTTYGPQMRAAWLQLAGQRLSDAKRRPRAA